MQLSALVSLALVGSGSASTIPLVVPKQEDAKYVSFPIERRIVRSSSLGKRDDQVTLFNATQTTYLFQLLIGTPQQTVNVVLDTGSFELWVDPTCSAASTPDQIAQCKSAGTYDATSSSSVKDQGLEKTLSYGKGEVEVAYVSDDIAVSGSNNSTMKDVIFGLGETSKDLSFGIAGVGHGYGFNTEYKNLVDELASQGITNSRAFSVALASKDASNGGVVVFGGLDTRKFTGPLYKFENLPPQTESDQTGPWRYWIQMASVGISKPGSGSKTYSNSGMPIVLDTGSTLSYLPQSIINQLAADFGSTVGQDGSISVPCSLQSQSGSVDFTFGTLTLKVPYHEFIWEITPNQCFVSVSPQGDTTALLGDSFLRSAYVVLDQDNQAIYMAPYVNCGQNETTWPTTGGNFTGACTANQNAAGRSLGAIADPKIIGMLALGVQCLMWLL